MDHRILRHVERKMGKRIVLSINTTWNIYNFRMGLVEALSSMGHEVCIVAPNDEYAALLESKGYKCHHINMQNKGTNPFSDLRLLFSYYRLYQKIKPDYILHYTIKPNVYGTLAASFQNIPCINNIAGLGTLFVKQGVTTRIAKTLYRLSQHRAHWIFFQNQEDRHDFIKGRLVPQHGCSVLPGSGVDTHKFAPRTRDKKSGEDRFVFLLIARLLWEKGIGEYALAARHIKEKYPNAEFQLLGFIDTNNKKAVSEEDISAWTREGLINYLGKSDDVREQIADADCVVLPSFYREGTPRSLLEAASMGKPIITTNTVGCKDVVTSELNGYLCEPKSVSSLVEAMTKILSLNETEIGKMGEESRKKILKEYDERIVINEYLASIGSRARESRSE